MSSNNTEVEQVIVRESNPQIRIDYIPSLRKYAVTVNGAAVEIAHKEHIEYMARIINKAFDAAKFY